MRDENLTTCVHDTVNWTSKSLGPMAMDTDDLRAAASRIGELGAYRIRRFGVEYPDLDSFTRAHDAPYRALDFVLPAVEVRLTSTSGVILYAPEMESEVLALERYLEDFRETPLVQYSYVYGFLLFVVAMVSIQMRHYHVLAVCFVVSVLFAHMLDDVMSRKALLRRPKSELNNPKMIWALLGLGLLVAQLVVEFIGV